MDDATKQPEVMSDERRLPAQQLIDEHGFDPDNAPAVLAAMRVSGDDRVDMLQDAVTLLKRAHE